MAGVLGLMALLAIFAGTSEPDVAPPVDYGAGSATPAPAARRPRPTEPVRAPRGAYRTTESGLKIWDVEAPEEGPVSAEGQVVAVDYVGWLENGIPVDSTYAAPQAIRFVVGGGSALKGLDEGVRGMRPGGIRQLIVPPELAFGAEGILNRVPPDATLAYHLKLIDLWEAPEAPSAVPEGAWQTLEGGTRWADLVVGDGPDLKDGASVAFDYTMWANEARVGTSLDRPAPPVVTLGTGQLIGAWERAMAGMKVGGHRVIVLPPAQAFGESGRAPDIPPNATLTIEVHARAME